MPLRFDPPPYQQPFEPTGYERANQWAGSLNDLGQTLGQNRQAEEAQKQQEFMNKIRQLQLQDEYGTEGISSVFGQPSRPSSPLKSFFQSRREPDISGDYNPNVNRPVQGLPMEGPQAPNPMAPGAPNFDENAYRQRFGSKRLQFLQDSEDRKRQIESGAIENQLRKSQIAENLSTADKNRRWKPGDDGPRLPQGFRWKSDGSMEAIPGGPAYLKTSEKGGAREVALNLYETAKQGLLDGLKGTNTGPIMGRIPAFTSGQQIAEGGVAAMAPVLKQLFRVSGEGVFTDRDQQLLLQMIPTRTANPDAIQTQIENIDRIVKAKLGMSDNQGGGGSGVLVGTKPKTVQQNGHTYTLNEQTGQYE